MFNNKKLFKGKVVLRQNTFFFEDGNIKNFRNLNFYDIEFKMQKNVLPNLQMPVDRFGVFQLGNPETAEILALYLTIWRNYRPPQNQNCKMA